jgi:hypothetical protein
MKRDTVKFFVGAGVILTHVIAFFGIVAWQSKYIPAAMDRLDVAMILVPVTAGYFLAIIRSAIQNQSSNEPVRLVNANYVFVVLLVTAAFCIAMLYFVFSFPAVVGPTITELRRWLVLLEIGFGSGFGLIAEDLFGRIEKVVVPVDAEKAGA